MSKLDELIKNINKQYKEEIMFKGDKSNLVKYELVPFSSPRLNYMLYGGLPMGRMIEFAGPEKSGKTTTALDMAKNCQKKFQEEYEFAKSKKNLKDGEIIRRKVCFVDAENTFDIEWANKLGVDVDDLIFIRPQEQYAEQLFDILKSVVETGEVGLIILDSIAQLVSKAAMEESMEKKQYGGIALALTKFCNIVVPLLGKYNCMCIAINQVREDLGNPYNDFITPGGRGFKHNCSIRLMFRQGSFIDSNNRELSRGAENPAGNLVNVRIEKSKVCRSDRRLGYYTLKYLDGIDYISDTIDVLIQKSVIIQRGSYFDLINPETGEVLYDGKIQGRPALINLLREDENLFELLKQFISYN